MLAVEDEPVGRTTEYLPDDGLAPLLVPQRRGVEARAQAVGGAAGAVAVRAVARDVPHHLTPAVAIILRDLGAELHRSVGRPAVSERALRHRQQLGRVAAAELNDGRDTKEEKRRNVLKIKKQRKRRLDKKEIK